MQKCEELRKQYTTINNHSENMKENNNGLKDEIIILNKRVDVLKKTLETKLTDESSDIVGSKLLEVLRKSNVTDAETNTEPDKIKELTNQMNILKKEVAEYEVRLDNSLADSGIKERTLIHPIH